MYTVEDIERIQRTVLAANDFMKRYGKGSQPRVVGDELLVHVGNAGKAVEDDSHDYTAFTAPAKYVKDIDLYKYTSLTYEQVSRYSHLKRTDPKRIRYKTYDKTNYNHLLCEYYLPDVLKVEEMLREERTRKKADEMNKADDKDKWN